MPYSIQFISTVTSISIYITKYIYRLSVDMCMLDGHMMIKTSITVPEAQLIFSLYYNSIWKDLFILMKYKVSAKSIETWV